MTGRPLHPEAPGVTAPGASAAPRAPGLRAEPGAMALIMLLEDRVSALESAHAATRGALHNAVDTLVSLAAALEALGRRVTELDSHAAVILELIGGVADSAERAADILRDHAGRLGELEAAPPAGPGRLVPFQRGDGRRAPERM